MGQNIFPIYKNKGIDECKKLCINHHQCQAFEYGRPQPKTNGLRTTGGYASETCILQSGTDSTGCNGASYNTDLYTLYRDCKGRDLQKHLFKYYGTTRYDKKYREITRSTLSTNLIL